MTHELFKGVFITCAFFLGVIFIPVIGAITSFLTPLPIIVFYYQYGRKVALQLIILTFLVASVAIAALKAPYFIAYLLQLLMLGFIVGELLRSNVNLTRIMTAACIAALIISSFSFYLLAPKGQDNQSQGLQSVLRENFQRSIQQYEKQGLSDEQIKWLSSSVDKIVPWLARLFPGIVLAVTAFIIWLNLVLAKHFIYSRLQHVPPPLQNLTLWKAPERLVWIVIFSGFAALYPSQEIKTVAFNVLLVTGVIYFFQGLAIIVYYFSTRKTPGPIRFLVYFFIFFQQLLTIAVATIGFIDDWANFRKLSDKPPSAKEQGLDE